MMEEGVADDAALKKLDKEVKDIISDAAEFAQDSPEPDPSELYTDVLAPA
jgi:pyruvate dehydrogenase E1 component alpha subunit